MTTVIYFQVKSLRKFKLFVTFVSLSELPALILFVDGRA